MVLQEMQSKAFIFKSTSIYINIHILCCAHTQRPSSSIVVQCIQAVYVWQRQRSVSCRENIYTTQKIVAQPRGAPKHGYDNHDIGNSVLCNEKMYMLLLLLFLFTTIIAIIS